MVEHFLSQLDTFLILRTTKKLLCTGDNLFALPFMNSHRLENARNEISFKAVPPEILRLNRVERLWVFDIFRMAAKFNLKSGGALGGRRGPSAVSQWEGAFVVPLLFTFGIEECGSYFVMPKFLSTFSLPYHQTNQMSSTKTY